MGLIAEYSPILALIIGFGLLVLGGELLVRGAVKAAECFGVSPLMIGIVLVGFGTSAPEMAISVYAALQGSPGIAIGNFVGSSIANILLILGLSAMVMPVGITPKALSRDGVVVIASATAFCFISLVYSLDRIIGFLFLSWLIGYLVYAWRQEQQFETAGGADATALSQEEIKGYSQFKARMNAYKPITLALLIAIAGLAILIYGGQILVNGAVKMAENYGISEEVIGLTIVAVGTSMPELVTSLVAALRKQSAVAVGNILGSNIYNILGVGGITGLLAPTSVPTSIVWYDNFLMLATSIALIVFARSNMCITRQEGSIMFVAYILYIWTLLPASAFG